MTEIKDRTFTNNEAVDADGVRFVNCNLEHVTLVYDGGEHPQFVKCTFGNFGWRFTGAALRTVQLLQKINNEQPNQEFISALFQKGMIVT